MADWKVVLKADKKAVLLDYLKAVHLAVHLVEHWAVQMAE